MRSFLAFLLVATAVAGCLGDDAASDDDASAMPAGHAPVFGEPLLIDSTRAGGEPVIAVTHEGTILVAAHPGWTHYHPSEEEGELGDELLTPASAQSYLWRSTDGGATWTHIGMPGLEQGPRSTGFGVSDPEFTVMADGAICYTDLLGLATSSVVCSTDDGITWLPGNVLASGGVNDRQWLASHADELYFTANYFVDHHIRASTDYGLTWEDRGNVPCSHDLVANPHTGNLIVGCPDGIAVSEDAGWTWETRSAGGGGGQRVMTEPAIDAAGNVWMSFTQGESDIWVKGSPDEGRTWPWTLQIGDAFANATGDNGTYVWPWISAGSDGRFAVSWIGTTHHEDSASNEGPWFLWTATVYDATTDAPTIDIQAPSLDPIHAGPICQSGTVCQVQSMQGDDAGDRRLGDFFESTIDAEGNLHVVVSSTTHAPGDVVSHVLYMRQTGGEPLLVADDVGVFMPTQG